MRRLGDILELKDADRALASRAIAGLAFDSRKTAPGDVFFALAGAKDDGLEHVGEALAKGAAAVVAERWTRDRQRRLRQGRRRPRRPRSRRRALLSAPARDHRRGHRHQRKDLGRRLRAPDLAGARLRVRLARHARRRVAPADRLRLADDAGPDRAARAPRPARRERRHPSRDGSLFAWPRPEAARRRAPRRGRVHQSHARPYGLSCDGRGLSRRQAEAVSRTFCPTARRP